MMLAIQCRCMGCGRAVTVYTEEDFTSVPCVDCGDDVMLDPEVWGWWTLRGPAAEIRAATVDAYVRAAVRAPKETP